MKRLRDSFAALKAKAKAMEPSAYREGLLDAYGFVVAELDKEIAHERALENIPEFYEESSAINGLKLAQPEFCSNKCPSVFRGPDSARHLPECVAMQAVIGAE